MLKLSRAQCVAVLIFFMLCIPGCSGSGTEEDCGGACGSGTVCDTSTGQCVADQESDATQTDADSCSSDTDCLDATLKCVDGACVSKCEGVVCDASIGEVCDAATGFCVGGSGCSSDGDCDDGFVCDDGDCKGGRYANCSIVACADGLNCANSPFGELCLNPCDSYEDCFLNERCFPDEPGNFASIANHCFGNFCQPGGDAFGFSQDAEFGGACDADGEGDGWCLGPFQGADGSDTGLCVGTDGAVEQGGTCDPLAGHNAESACSGGICLEETSTCATHCSVFEATSCPTATVCFPVWTGNGVCVDHEPGELAQLGENCGDTLGLLNCEQGAACAPRGFATGAENVCMAYCLTDAQSGAIGSCEAGVCTGYTQDNPTIGVCLVD